MAKLTVTVAVFLFILALARARTPLDQLESELIPQDLLTDEQESDQQTTAAGILLPSEKLESEPEIEVEAKPENTEFEKPESETNDFVPLTVINFHPVNRHFPRHPSLTLRHRRPCHHHRLGKPWRPARFHNREVSYGNDMLIASGDNKEVPQIPARWVKFQHGDTDGPRFPYWHDDDVARREGFKRPRYHHHHFHHRHVEDEEKDREGREHKTGFLMKIRKFLNEF